jgi:hypothetical protein
MLLIRKNSLPRWSNTFNPEAWNVVVKTAITDAEKEPD